MITKIKNFRDVHFVVFFVCKLPLFSEIVPRLEFYPTFALSVIYEFVNNQKRI